MATINKRVSARTNSTTYQAIVRRKGFKSRTATFKRKRDAEAWVRKTEAELDQLRVDPKAAAGNHTLAELVDRYIDDCDPDNPERLRWWSAHLGHIKLADISAHHIEQALVALAAEPTPRGGRKSTATLNRYHGAISAALNYALPRAKTTGKRRCFLGWLQANPAHEIGRLREDNTEVRYLSEAEVDALRTACQATSWPTLWLLACCASTSGARLGELLGLTWGQVVFHDDHASALLTKTKNGKPRVIYFYGEAHQQLVAHTQDHGRIFPAGSGWRPHWTAARKAAGLWAPGTDQHVKFHHLRHHTASKLVQNGVSLQVVAEVLGHSGTAVTQRYAHLAPGAGAAALQEVFA